MVIFLPLINRVEVLVRFIAPPPVLPSNVVNVLKEVKFPDTPSNKLLNCEKPPKPNGPKKDVLMLLLLG